MRNKMSNQLKIKNIIFDLAEVLLTGIRGTGISLTEKHKLENNLVHKSPWIDLKTPLLIPLVEEFFRGNVSEDEYIQAVLEKYPELGTQKWLKDHIRDNFKEVEGTREIVLELKRKGYKIALLSIHAKEWIEYCEQKFNFHELFDVLSYSYEDKVSKPDPASFLNVLKKLNALPEECIFIDDSKTNIAAAEKLGIKSILFSDAKNLRAKLVELLPDFK